MNGIAHPHDVGLNMSDYTRKNNDAQRDNTELFYPLVRKLKDYAMNRFRESYVAVIAMPVSRDLKGQTYAWGSPRLLQDLPEFLDDCAFEVSHGTMDKRVHGYAKALADYKWKALRDLAELNRKHAQGQDAKAKGVDRTGDEANREKGKGSAAKLTVPTSPLPRTPDAGQKRKCPAVDNGDEDRPPRPKVAGQGEAVVADVCAISVDAVVVVIRLRAHIHVVHVGRVAEVSVTVHVIALGVVARRGVAQTSHLFLHELPTRLTFLNLSAALLHERRAQVLDFAVLRFASELKAALPLQDVLRHASQLVEPRM
ncbi:hypothetical protein AURDEDRAFT_175055 [Auricularia subglabra TFB-10046 SS5]|nr:hypothetical protein AURDEDRAFT_175055 [Auricularia subglabra TFB-10046 SS5]